MSNVFGKEMEHDALLYDDYLSPLDYQLSWVVQLYIYIYTYLC